MKKFYSYGFPANRKSDKIFEYDSYDFQKVVDSLFQLSDHLKKNKENLYFKKPMNLVVFKNDSELILGIETAKAIFGTTFISAARKIFKKEETTDSFLMRICRTELGFTRLAFIRIKLELFNNIYPELLKFFNSGLTPKERYKLRNELSSNVRQCAKKILNDIKKYPMMKGETMQVNPIFITRDISVDPNLCFLVMPFNDKRKELLEKVIKPEIEKKFNLNVLKSGDIRGANQNIMENIWTYINQASVIIADMSDGNPNVFYELGICHTLGKPVILLCDEESREKDYGGRLPFDLSGLQVIFYSNSGYGPTQLTNDVIDAIANMRKQFNY